jgi:hypothetical protein
LPRDTAQQRFVRIAKATREARVKRKPASEFGKEFARWIEPRLKGREGSYLKLAFAQAGLNPFSPSDWVTLLSMFVLAHRKGRPGRRKGSVQKWDDDYFWLLGVAYQTVKQDHPRWSQKRICEEIKKEWLDEFKNFTVDAMVRQLPKAMNWRPPWAIKLRN